MRLFHDDDPGSRHQRFVVSVPGGQTLLIAHNAELGERIPLGLGDRIRFRGLYEWNDLGGLVHWTHTDPLGELEGGWVEFRKRRYGAQ